ncbi:hypothetical protein ABBQ32_008026 [Trebouxia sp. C0010 RCD-2024]
MGVMGDLPIGPSLRSDHQHSLHVFNIEERAPETPPISEALSSIVDAWVSVRVRGVKEASKTLKQLKG